MARVYSNSLGIEDLLDEMEMVIMSDINEALAEVYERRGVMDQERAQRRNLPYEALEYDELGADHIYIGYVPSFVREEVPPSTYPYIALTWDDYSPDAEDA